MELRMALMHLWKIWVQVIGGCCGTRPDHIQQWQKLPKP